MTNGIVQTKKGFAVNDFETGNIVFTIGQLKYGSYLDAVEGCRGRFYPLSYYPYLLCAEHFDTVPDADTWENMVYEGDPRGVWDGERKEYRNVSSMDRGAATEDEIAYIDALDSTFKSLTAMVEKK